MNQKFTNTLMGRWAKFCHAGKDEPDSVGKVGKDAATCGWGAHPFVTAIVTRYTN